MKKRILSILLTLCMVLCLMPTAAFAEGNEDTPMQASILPSPNRRKAKR